MFPELGFTTITLTMISEDTIVSMFLNPAPAWAGFRNVDTMVTFLVTRVTRISLPKRDSRSTY